MPVRTRPASPPNRRVMPSHVPTRPRCRSRWAAGREGYAKSMSDVGEQPVRRNTRQRDAVMGLLGEVDGFHSAQELHLMLRSKGVGVGLTTVYRTLQLLAD